MDPQNSYYEQVEEILTACGFKKEDRETGDFKSAFTKRGILANYAFLIAAIEDPDFKAISAMNYVEAGRQWCKDYLEATWFVREAGLNLIFLHKGQVDAAVLMNQVDSVGLEGAICQSITALDTTDGDSSQETTWIVVGNVKKALQKLRKIT